jgi:hypothetical protein
MLHEQSAHNFLYHFYNLKVETWYTPTASSATVLSEIEGRRVSRSAVAPFASLDTICKANHSGRTVEISTVIFSNWYYKRFTAIKPAFLLTLD